MWSRLWSSSAPGVLKRTLLAANTQSLSTPPRCTTTRTIDSSAYSHYYYSGRGGGAAADASTPFCKIKSICFSSAIDADAEASSPSSNNNNNNKNDKNILITSSEAKRLMRLVNVEALKMKLGMESREIIPFSDLLEACQSIGIARSHDEAVTFAHVLDDAGVVLLFRDQVYLHPDKVGSYPCPPFPSFLLCFICTFLPFYLLCMFLIVNLVFNLLSYVCFHNPINCFATLLSGGWWGQTETYIASPPPSPLFLSPLFFSLFLFF